MTSPPPEWWFCYIHDSHMCLRKDKVDEFHQQLNSVNHNMPFTLELEDTKGQAPPFQDTITRVVQGGSLAQFTNRKK